MKQHDRLAFASLDVTDAYTRGIEIAVFNDGSGRF